MIPRILNFRTDAIPNTAVRVDRATPYGNPFQLIKDGTRDECCDKFEAWVQKQAWFEDACRALRGKDLVCWCAPLRCHAETWIKFANRENAP